MRAIDIGVVPLRRNSRVTTYTGGRIIADAWAILSEACATTWVKGEYCWADEYAEVAMLILGTKVG